MNFEVKINKHAFYVGSLVVGQMSRKNTPLCTQAPFLCLNKNNFDLFFKSCRRKQHHLQLDTMNICMRRKNYIYVMERFDFGSVT